MKKHLAIIGLALSSMTFACNEKKEDGSITEDGVMQVEEVTSENGQILAGKDSSMRLSDGTRIPVEITSADSINLPQELLTMIEKTDDLDPGNIVAKRRFIENNITYYELEFKMREGSNQTFIFDEDGKRKSKDE
ncbi:hypothetical protein LV84_00270 [Algoriphagus ratkowskyi]|uniref:Uncharacterized protein n=1 Tax=Algoriphagus ratkowskyi TaxID=57028 RepID=A0A2W7TD97_9BACT|nr:hypothetical protein [Algoriphagus ratkowskyi]PZX61282.1 hypothetical protein LV84_00270 [Algoriphagus ratkowskyi]TXD79396.1 hypothetical protein ESW18_03970 [Algoriphagus ratkowskyi]